MLEGTAVLWEEFQSTLPSRGATAKQHKGTGMFCDKCAISKTEMARSRVCITVRTLKFTEISCPFDDI